MIIALLLESDGPGGAENVLLTLGRTLRARGHEVVPVGPRVGEGWLGERFREEGFEPETFDLRRSIDPQCLLALKAIMERRGVEVMHGHEFTMAVYGAAAARLGRLPHVITMHGGRYYATALRRRVAFRWAMRNSHRVVAVSEATRRDLEESLGRPARCVDVIPNGQRLRQGVRSKLRDELGLSDADFLIVNVGNLYSVKGQDSLVRALARSLSEGPGLPLHLAIAGRGEQEVPLRTLALDLGIADRVHLLGFRDDVPDVLAAADLFALPSLSEGLPLALLEAMFAGLPVVASAVGGIPEVVRHDREGLLCTPGSAEELAAAVLALFRDSALRDRIGRAGRDLAETRYTPDAMASAYEALYRSALQVAGLSR